MNRAVPALLVIGLATLPVEASFYFSPDVPTVLAGTRYQPSDLVLRNDVGAYSLVGSLPAGTPIDALFRMDSGDWLLSVAKPTNLGGVTYDPRSVIRLSSTATFSLFFNGATAGIPVRSNVDAAFLVGGDTGDLVVSFDVPTTIAATTYEPADLVRISGGTFSLFFDASAAAIPLSTNVTGAGQRATRTFLTFDVPTRLGSTTYLPGQVVAWNGSQFSNFAVDSGWPINSRLNALSLGPCLDGDGDGYGAPGDAACSAGNAADCDDGAAAVYPGAPQLCDGINTDCSDPAWPGPPANETDADGDGFRICAGDCGDANPTVYPAAPQLCDGSNNNCSDPLWPAVPANETDADGDGYPICAADCDDANGTVWGTPGEVAGLTLTGTTLNWSAPASLGGVSASVQYDTLRSTSRNDFVTDPPATCVESDDGPNTAATDSDIPAVGAVFYYLVRAQNACPGALGIGSLGTTSSGAARTARDCP